MVKEEEEEVDGWVGDRDVLLMRGDAEGGGDERNVELEGEGV